MRRLLIILGAALVVGAGLFQLLARQQGYLVFSVGPYVVEATLWGALLIIAGLFLVAYGLRKLWLLVVLPHRWWRWRAGKKQARGRDKTVQGMLDYLEGNWPQAINNLTHSARSSDMPVLNYVGAAAASFNLGDGAAVQRLLANAEEAGASDALTVGLLRARLMLQDQEFDKALALAKSLHRKAPSHPTVLRLLASAYKGVRDWRAVESLLPDLKKHKAVSSQELLALEVETFREILAEFATTRPVNRSQTEQKGELDRLWDGLPRKLHKNAELFGVYVDQMQKLGLPEKAESRLRRFINKLWDDELVRLYGVVQGDNSVQLTTAEAWLREHPDNPVLLQTLGRLCVRNQLWGKGREYYDRALKLDGDNPQLWLELGELLLILQDTRGSNDCFKKGLQVVVSR